MTEKGRNDEERMTNDGGNEVKNISLYKYSVLAGHIPSCGWLPSKGQYSDGKVEGNVVKTSSMM